jgi:hypothetical protein
MNQPFSIPTEIREAEETLRLVAALHAPAGLEQRIHAALKVAPASAKVLEWPVRRAGGPLRTWMRGAAAAAIVSVVAGGGWAIYSRVQPADGPRVVNLPRVTGSGGFSSAGAMRTPQTLEAPSATQPTVSQPAVNASQPSAQKKSAHRHAAHSAHETKR